MEYSKQIWSKKIKLFQMKGGNGEFNGNAYLSCFGSEIPYLGKFGLKSKLVKMKVDCLD